MAWCALAALVSYSCCCHGDITLSLSGWGGVGGFVLVRCSVAVCVKKRRCVCGYVCVCLRQCRCACMALTGLCLSVWLTPPTHVAPMLAFLNPQPTRYGHEWTHFVSLSPSVSQFLSLCLPDQQLCFSLCLFTRTHLDPKGFVGCPAGHCTTAHTELDSGLESHAGRVHSYISL